MWSMLLFYCNLLWAPQGITVMVLLLGLIIIIGLEERELHEPCNTCLYCVSEYKAEVISHVEAPLRAVEEISICIAAGQLSLASSWPLSSWWLHVPPRPAPSAPGAELLTETSFCVTVALKVNLSVLKAFIAALLHGGLKYTELTPSYVDRLHAQAASPRSRWTGWTTTGGAWVRSSGRPNWSPAPPTPTSPAICQTTHKVTQAGSYTVGDMVHITEMFGGQSTWLGDRLLVCGGANWTSSHDQCHSWSPRYIQTLPAMLML